MSNKPGPDYLQDTQPYVSQPPVQYSSQEQFAIESSPRRRKGCGCFFGGCLGALLGMLVIAGLGLYGAYTFYGRQLAKYTSETPIRLPSADVTDQDVEAIVQKLDDFEEQFEVGQSPQELVITIDEINALIADNPELRGRVYVTIEDGDLRAEVSFPVDQIPGGKGRFFNGSIALHTELEDGVLIIQLVDAEVNGTPVPEMMMEPFRETNLAKDLYRDVELAKALQRCEKLTVESDRIVLKVREKPNDSPQPEVSADSAPAAEVGETPADAQTPGIASDAEKGSQGEVSEEFNTPETATEPQ